jgi:hypothetical protein
MIYERGSTVTFLHDGKERQALIVGIFVKDGATGHYLTYRDRAKGKVMVRLMATELAKAERALRENTP